MPPTLTSKNSRVRSRGWITAAAWKTVAPSTPVEEPVERRPGHARRRRRSRSSGSRPRAAAPRRRCGRSSARVARSATSSRTRFLPSQPDAPVTTAIGGDATDAEAYGRGRGSIGHAPLLSGHRPVATKPAQTPARRARRPDQRPMARPTPAAPPRRPTFPCFDGLRALAALSIVLTHVAFASGANSPERPRRVLRPDGRRRRGLLRALRLPALPAVRRSPTSTTRPAPGHRPVPLAPRSCASTRRTGWC